jgi:HAMP domain-containing protein
VRGPASIQVISRAYIIGLITRCGLLFAGGLIITGIILYFTSQQPLGPSYQETFARLSQLKQEMLIKSIITYLTLTLLILAGVIFITVFYSHRVVGPLVSLKRTTLEIASGNFAQPAKLREHDAIHPMAAALNAMRDAYKQKIELASQQCEAMQTLLKSGPDAEQLNAIAEKAKGIKGILFPLKL